MWNAFLGLNVKNFTYDLHKWLKEPNVQFFLIFSQHSLETVSPLEGFCDLPKATAIAMIVTFTPQFNDNPPAVVYVTFFQTFQIYKSSGSIHRLNICWQSPVFLENPPFPDGLK
jgi:hypothetical protein